MARSDVHVEILRPDGVTLDAFVGEAPSLLPELALPARRGATGIVIELEGAPLHVGFRSEQAVEGHVLRVGPEPAAGDASSLRVSALVLALLVAAALVLSQGSDEREDPVAPTPTPLFGTESEAVCPGAGMGERLEREGEAHADRRPFEPSEGPRAVATLRAAARCHEEAGSLGRASALVLRAEELESGLESDYRARRFRLERALREGRSRDALVEARALQALLASHADPYVEWLARMERVLGARVGRERSRRGGS